MVASSRSDILSVLLKDKKFIRFLVKFLLLFAIFYLGTELVIGLAAPGGMYSKFVDHYFDYVSGISNTLVFGTQAFLSMLGYETYTADNFVVRLVGGSGVRIAFGCVGYGVMSFWLAYILAVSKKWTAKLVWLVGGWLFLWIINVVRIGLLVLAYNKGWGMPLGIDHHTWFNIVAYCAIFSMMYFFEKKPKQTNAHH